MACRIVNLSLASAIPTFSGNPEENVEFFIQQIKEVAQLEDWPENKKLLILKLNVRENAQKFILESPLFANANFENASRLLTEKFKKPENFQTIQADFNSIQQMPNQSISNLIEIINNKAKFLSKIDDNTPASVQFIDSIKLNKFLESVKSDIKIEILKFGPTNFS